MKKAYGKAIWKTLNEYGVWHPGADIRLGDFGTISDGCFVPKGNIFNFVDSTKLKIRTANLSSLLIISDHGIQSYNKGNQNQLGSMDITFNGRAGVLIVGNDVNSHSFSDIKELNSVIDLFNDWHRDYRIVTTIRRCGKYTVHTTGSGGGTLKLQAEPGLISNFVGGNPKLMSQIKFTSASGLKMTGNNGAISIQAHKRALWGNDLKLLQANHGEIKGEVLVPCIEPVC